MYLDCAFSLPPVIMLDGVIDASSSLVSTEHVGVGKKGI